MLFISPAVRMDGNTLSYLDQRLLPIEERYETTTDFRSVINAIRSLAIRGAPLIGVAGAYAVLLAAFEYRCLPYGEFRTAMSGACGEIGSARPTARNLSWAVERMRMVVDAASNVDETIAQLAEASLALHRDDAHRCAAMAEHGAALLPANARVVTHCNSGFLATGGIGTALGVITEGWKQGRVEHVYVDETRPLLQGARLTMWELERLGIPCTLITDGTSASLMARELINTAITGADRIAPNGDSANKIGTYALAVSAHYHEIPFFIAAPVSTIDPAIANGKEIVIEERDPSEVTSLAGMRITTEGARAFAPAFDVTPASLITAIITEHGPFRAPYDLRGLSNPRF
jgi:methylthioribose-1-phosphate isomerase